jgi:hypothetical protein
MPARPHQLCEMCNKICRESRLIRNIPELYGQRDENDLDLDEIKEDKQQFKFHNLSNLKASYEGGCHLCTMIWDVLDKCTDLDGVQETETISLQV